MDRSEALRELRENAGSQFDPRVARTLLEILGDDSPPPLGSPSETRDQTLSRELEELAAELGAEDLFVFRRVGGGLYAHLGGVGRGAGWAGNIELDSGDEHHLRAAVAGKTAIWVELESARRILGPYYGRSAAIVPCSPESVIVFGSATHSLTATGPERTAWLAQRAQRLVLEVSPAKRLADELEVLAAVRDVTTVSGDSMPETLKAIANRTRTALSAAYVAVATVAGAELDPAIGASAGAWQPADLGAAIRALARFAAHPSALPLLRQDVIQMPDAPAGFRHGDGVCSIYVLPIGSPAVAVLLVVHAGPGPRGFTDLCQRVAGAVSDAAELVVRRAIAQERLRAENRRLLQQISATGRAGQTESAADGPTDRRIYEARLSARSVRR